MPCFRFDLSRLPFCAIAASLLAAIGLFVPAAFASDQIGGTRSVGGDQMSTAAAAERPNILIVLTDDMGFSDLGCYGGEIETPNLDALAANGLRFTDFHNTARCWPTRATLMSGVYSSGLSERQVTIAEENGIGSELFSGSNTTATCGK